jgi:hypothetical protein
MSGAASAGAFAHAQRDADAAISRASSKTLGAGGALGPAEASASSAAAPLHPGGLYAQRAIAAGEAFVFPHALHFTRATLAAALKADAGGAARALLLADAAACAAADCTPADLEDAAWRCAEPAASDGAADEDTCWAVPAGEIASLRHADALGAATFAVAPLPRGTAAAAGLPHGGCVAWALRDVAAGEEATRDAAPGRSRSVSRAATLLALLPPHRWADVAERDRLAAAVAEASAAPPPAPQRRPDLHAESCAATPPLLDPTPPVCVYTNYPLLADALAHVPGFEVAPSLCGIDVLWLNSALRADDFAALPPGLFVNQFPYEGCLVCKVNHARAARAGGG